MQTLYTIDIREEELKLRIAKENNAFTYNYIDDEKALHKFIHQNFVLGNSKNKHHKNNTHYGK